MPTFCVMTPVRIRVSLQFDLDVDTGREVELHQCVDGLRRGIDDVEEPFVRADFELLAALLVHMRGTVHGETLHIRRQGNGSPHLRAGAFGRVHDFPRRIVENAVIERLQPDSNVLPLHALSLQFGSGVRTLPYFTILATTPEPTVRPPSRMAKRSFSSIAMGTMSSTSIETLSPGITISVPSGSFTIPVTSVVRK